MALDSGNFTQGASAVFGVGRHPVDESFDRYTPGVFKEILDMIPMGRLGETAKAAHFPSVGQEPTASPGADTFDDAFAVSVRFRTVF